MKKIFLLALTCNVFFLVHAQQTTVTYAYYKPKIGHRDELYKGLAAHVAKFRPKESPYAFRVVNVTGGDHHGELLILSNSGLSFKQRDEQKPTPPEINTDFYKNVSPHIEAMTAGGILLYRKEYSNVAFEGGSDKSYSTCYSLNPSVLGKEFWDIAKKLPKVFDRLGRKIAAYTSFTGGDLLCLTQRLEKGWADLDDRGSVEKAYDEEYGAGSYAKDIVIFRAAIEKRNSYMLSYNKDLSSK